jgi:hypothetical protein
MKIETKLAPGQKGFVIHENKVHPCAVVHMKIDAKKGEEVSKGAWHVEVATHYTLDLLDVDKTCTDKFIHNVEEARVFVTKEELLASL